MEQENKLIKKSKLDNKWIRAAIPALLIHCSIGTVYCWSSFSAKLAEQIGSTTSVVGWAFSLAIFFLGMSAAMAGRFVEKDIHRSSILACICFTIGMVGTGLTIFFSNWIGTMLSVLCIFLFYGCIMGIGLGVGYLTPVKTLMLWFPENKGLATGISIMGFGLAKAIASPIMNYLQDIVGLAMMFFILSAVYFVMMYIGHLLLKKPAGWTEETEKEKVKLKDLIKNRTFVASWIMFYLNITCGLALISYEKPILQLIGMSTIAISIIQSFTAGTNALGRLGFSTFSDHLKDRNTVYKIIFIMSCVISILAFFTKFSQVGTSVIIVILLLIINAGYGGGFSSMPALLSSRFGMNNISRIHGFVLSAWAFAGLTGNQISSIIVSKTGQYEYVYLTIGIIYAIAFAVSLLIPKQENISK